MPTWRSGIGFDNVRSILSQDPSTPSIESTLEATGANRPVLAALSYTCARTTGTPLQVDRFRGARNKRNKIASQLKYRCGTTLID